MKFRNKLATCASLLALCDLSVAGEILVGQATVVNPLPKVAISDNNSFVVTWNNQVNIFDLQGSTIKDASPLSASHVSARADGEFIVSSSSSILRLSETGEAISIPDLLSYQSKDLRLIDGIHDLSMNLYGEAVAVKAETVNLGAFVPNPTRIYEQFYGFLGHVSEEPNQVNSETENRRAPKVSLSTNKGYVITWRTAPSVYDVRTTGSGNIYASLYDENGELKKKEFLVNSSFSDGYKKKHDVAIDGSGNFVSVWNTYTPGEPEKVTRSSTIPAVPPIDKIKARRINSDGEPITEEFFVHLDDGRLHTSPRVAMNYDGHFVVVWNAYVFEGDRGDVLARFYDAEANPLGEPFVVNSNLVGKQYAQDVSINTTGQVVITWVDYPGVDMEMSVFAKVFQHPLGGEIPSLYPKAFAGEDDSVLEGEEYSLDATLSYAPFANIPQYAWTQVDGTPVSLIDSNSAIAKFSAPYTDLVEGEALEFEVTVTSDEGHSSSDRVVVHVNDSVPIAYAGEDLFVNMGEEFTISGLGSYDPDGEIVSYRWTGGWGADWVRDSHTETLVNNFESAGYGDHRELSDGSWDSWSFTYVLTVTDDSGHSSSDEVVVVMNMAPRTDAGEDRVVIGGATDVLDGSNSIDYDGSIVGYYWEQTQGSVVEIANPNDVVAQFSVPDVGRREPETLSFKLTATDDKRRSRSDSVVYRISPSFNVAPVANAGEDFSVIEGEQGTLDGRLSYDLDDSAGLRWRQISGPTVELNSSWTSQPTFIAPVVYAEGAELVFELTSEDQYGLVGVDTVSIYVENINQQPIARAGAPSLVDEGDTVVMRAFNEKCQQEEDCTVYSTSEPTWLSTAYTEKAYSYDLDRESLRFAWVQTQGPLVELVEPGSSTPSFVAPEVTSSGATLEFSVTVTDATGASDVTSVQIEINNTHKVADDSGMLQPMIVGRLVGALGGSISGMTVYVYDTEGKYVASRNTDANGIYKVPVALNKGYHVVYGDNEDYMVQVHGGDWCYPDEVCDVLSGELIYPVDEENLVSMYWYSIYEVKTGGVITGYITALDSDEALRGVRVRVYKEDGQEVISTAGNSDKEGRYSVVVPASGNYYVYVEGDGSMLGAITGGVDCYRGCDISTGDVIEVTFNKIRSDVNFSLRNASSISGTLTNKRNSHPISGLPIDVYSIKEGKWLGRVYAEINGSYEYGPLQAGEYYVKVSSSSYISQIYGCDHECSFQSATIVSVGHEQEVDGVDFSLEMGGRINGTLQFVDVDGAVSTLRVLYSKNGKVVQKYYDSSHHYSFFGLPEGEYYVAVGFSNHYIGKLYSNGQCYPDNECDLSQGEAIYVVPETTVDNIDLVVNKGGAIKGRVSSSKGPVDGERIELIDSEGKYLGHTLSDILGFYILDGVPEGSYYLKVKPFDGYKQRVYGRDSCELPEECDVTQGVLVGVYVGEDTAGIDIYLEELEKEETEIPEDPVEKGGAGGGVINFYLLVLCLIVIFYRSLIYRRSRIYSL